MPLLSRRAFFRDLGVFSAATALGLNPVLLEGQTAAVQNPFANDVTVFLIGPWLLFANAPGRPGMMLALTVDDPMHRYRHGIYRGARPTAELPARDYAVGVTRPRTTAAADLFGSLTADLMCLDGSHGRVALATPVQPGIRRIYLPKPDAVIPAVFIPKTADGPLFEWPDRPAGQDLPAQAATAVILRYSGASALSVDNGLQATRGDHVHFETVIESRPASALDEQQHAIGVMAKLTQTITYAGRPLNLTFRPGVSHPVTIGVPGVTAQEVGSAGLQAGLRWPTRRDESAPHLMRAAYVEGGMMNFAAADCSGGMIAVRN